MIESLESAKILSPIEDKADKEIQNADAEKVDDEANKNKNLTDVKEWMAFPIQEKREVMKTLALDLIDSEIKKYNFDKNIEPEIKSKLQKKYYKKISNLNSKELDQIYKKQTKESSNKNVKIAILPNVFGKEIIKEINEIMSDYNRIAIWNMFKDKIDFTDKKTWETVESMIDKTDDETINRLGFVLNYNKETRERILTDLLLKIQNRNRKNPDIQLINFDDATINTAFNGEVQKGINGQGIRETSNETIGIDTIKSEFDVDDLVNNVMDKINKFTNSSTSDIIKVQIPVDFFSKIAKKLNVPINAVEVKIKEKIFKKVNSTGHDIKDIENIKIEKLSDFSAHINITREGVKAYRTGLGDNVFEVPVEQKNNIEKKITNLFQGNPGENTTVYINIPGVGNQNILEQFQELQKKFTPKRIEINIVPEIKSVEIFAEVVDYGDFTSKLSLAYNQIGNHEEIEKILPKELTDILNDETATIIGGEIYGSASYQHTEYTKNPMLSNRESTNNGFVLENKTEDQKIIEQVTTDYKEVNWNTEPAGSVTNNPTLSKDRALSFLEYIYSIDGGKKIKNLKNIKISYGVNGITLEEAKEKTKTNNNKDQKLIPEFEPYQYATLHLQYKKTKRIDTELFPLTKDIAATEGFQIRLKTKNDTIKTPKKKRNNFFENVETVQAWQNISCGKH